MSVPRALPRLIEGGVHRDERGTLSFVNGLDLDGVRRFYTIRARDPGTVRGWAGHRREQKWFSAMSGSILLAVIEPDDWTTPSGEIRPVTYELSSDSPRVLHVPGGFATAIVQLTSDALLLVLSSGTIGEAPSDDYRYPIGTWSFEVTTPP